MHFIERDMNGWYSARHIGWCMRYSKRKKLKKTYIYPSLSIQSHYQSNNKFHILHRRVGQKGTFPTIWEESATVVCDSLGWGRKKHKWMMAAMPSYGELNKRRLELNRVRGDKYPCIDKHWLDERYGR